MIHRCQFQAAIRRRGRERGVAEASRLFEGRTHVLTPTHETDPETPRQGFPGMDERIGAVPVVMGPIK